MRSRLNWPTMISKREREYQEGIERLQAFLVNFLDDQPPRQEDLEEEVGAIPALRPIHFSLRSEYQAGSDEPFVILLCESYERYDDVLPQEIDIHILPSAYDNEKELFRYLNTLS